MKKKKVSSGNLFAFIGCAAVDGGNTGGLCCGQL